MTRSNAVAAMAAILATTGIGAYMPGLQLARLMNGRNVSYERSRGPLTDEEAVARDKQRRASIKGKKNKSKKKGRAGQ
jgi:hypothetical protein